MIWQQRKGRTCSHSCPPSTSLANSRNLSWRCPGRNHLVASTAPAARRSASARSSATASAGPPGDAAAAAVAPAVSAIAGSLQAAAREMHQSSTYPANMDKLVRICRRAGQVRSRTVTYLKLLLTEGLHWRTMGMGVGSVISSQTLRGAGQKISGANTGRGMSGFRPSAVMLASRVSPLMQDL